MIAADPAACHDDRPSPDGEVPDHVAIAGHPAVRVVACEHAAGRADHRACGDRELIDPVPEPQLDQPVGDGPLDDLDERFDDSRSRSPDDVEPWHRVPVAGRGVSAALGPPDDGKESNTLGTQPCALLAGREGEVCLGPLFAPEVLVTIELGAGEPVLSGEFLAVVHPHEPLFGGVDEEQPAERPPGLPAQVGLGLLLEHDDALASGDQLGGGDQAGKSRPDDDRIRLGGCAAVRHPVPSERSSGRQG